MISRTYDIIALWYHSKYLWYSYWYHLWYHGPASMISRTYDIIGPWYHIQYHVIWILISYMISKCLHPPLKTHCIERSQCRALQVQVRNQRRLSSSLLDEARLVLGVQHIHTCDVQRSGSGTIWTPGCWSCWACACHHSCLLSWYRWPWSTGWLEALLKRGNHLQQPDPGPWHLLCSCLGR